MSYYAISFMLRRATGLKNYNALFLRLKEYSQSQPSKVALVIEDEVITYGELWTYIAAPVDSMEETIKALHPLDCMKKTIKLLHTVDSMEEAFKSLHTVELIQTYDIKEQLILWLRAIYEGRRPIICHADLSEKRRQELIARYGLINLEMTQPHVSLRDDVRNDLDALERVKKSQHSSVTLFTSQHAIPKAASFGVLTSGTTGLPKVLWRSLRSWVDFFDEQNRVFKVTKDSILFIHGSMSFTGNLNSLLATLYVGGTTVVGSILRPKRWYELLATWKATHMYVLPTKLRMLLPCMKDNLPHLSLIFTGSQLLDYKLVLTLKKLQPQTECILYYGASELNYITYCTFDEWLEEPNTVGYAFDRVTVSLDDAACIVVDTPYGIEDIERPYTVGDVGEFSPTGRLQFKGRADAIINRGGYKLSLPYLESELLCVEGIDDVVVLAVDDALRGQQPIAFVVPVEGASRDTICEAIHNRFLPKECPKQIFWLSEFPLTHASKIDLNALRRLYEMGQSKMSNKTSHK